jgi:hypothetical protein
MSCHRLIIDVTGDVEVKAISKQMVIDLKDTMARLPSNLYIDTIQERPSRKCLCWLVSLQ